MSMTARTSDRTFAPLACKRFNAVQAASNARGVSRGANFRRAPNWVSDNPTGAALTVTVFAIRIAQGHRFQPIEFLGAALVIGALIANNVVVRRAAAPAQQGAKGTGRVSLPVRV